MTIPPTLLSGYQRFRAGRFLNEAARYRALSEGQQPTTMIIGCADSRVDPATIFAAGPGELFVVRNVAALAPPCEAGGGRHGTSAALEFAVDALRVHDIVVLGHGQCGGVQAALAAGEGRPVGQFIGPWVGMLDAARDRLLAEQPVLDAAGRQKALEFASIRQSLRNLESFPFIATAVREGRLALHGAWFSIGEGQLLWLDVETATFAPVEARTQA